MLNLLTDNPDFIVKEKHILFGDPAAYATELNKLTNPNYKTMFDACLIINMPVAILDEILYDFNYPLLYNHLYKKRIEGGFTEEYEKIKDSNNAHLDNMIKILRNPNITASPIVNFQFNNQKQYWKKGKKNLQNNVENRQHNNGFSYYHGKAGITRHKETPMLDIHKEIKTSCDHIFKDINKRIDAIKKEVRIDRKKLEDTILANSNTYWGVEKLFKKAKDKVEFEKKEKNSKEDYDHKKIIEAIIYSNFYKTPVRLVTRDNNFKSLLFAAKIIQKEYNFPVKRFNLQLYHIKADPGYRFENDYNVTLSAYKKKMTLEYKIK